MKYYSTNGQAPHSTFREAIFTGLPADSGLFHPTEIPLLQRDFLDALSDRSLVEIGFEVSKIFVGDEIPPDDLEKIVAEVLNFEIPLVQVSEDVFSLELYHGPTYAFKDVGARFLARCLSYFIARSGEKLTILVATSGDTGSAVANGFYEVPGIDVVLLYPGGGKVSKIQEQQLTTLGANITALEIDGTFDDCQRMVKSAFLDEALRAHRNLTSANSINIARLIPQSFYYFHAMAQLPVTEKPVVFSVPSGNYGNLSAGIMAKKMGLQYARMLACSNINKIVPDYLQNGVFHPRTSEMTISNAMDVGNPSNFARMNAWYDENLAAMQRDIGGYWFSDEDTRKELKEVHQQHDYLMDPHGTIGYLGLKAYQEENEVTGIFLETAHPAKFIDVVEETIGETIEVPARLKDCLEKEKQATELPPDYEALKEFLW